MPLLCLIIWDYSLREIVAKKKRSLNFHFFLRAGGFTHVLFSAMPGNDVSLGWVITSILGSGAKSQGWAGAGCEHRAEGAMACDRRHYEHVLDEFDVCGAVDSTCCADSTNLLVEPLGVVLTEDSLQLRVMQYGPEGSGKHAVGKDMMTIPHDVPLQELTIDWLPLQPIPPMGQKCWLRKVQEGLLQTCYTFDDHSKWMPVNQSFPVGRAIHVLELFSGGYGGWQFALEFLSSVLDNTQIDTIAVEKDLQLAMSYAISHQSNMIHGCEQMRSDMFQEGQNWVLCADITDPSWLPEVAKWGVDLCTISSPCPPWSGASTSQGLKSAEGRLLMHAILQCRFLRPHFITIEQVHGFASHPDKETIEQILHFAGYRLIW